MFYSWFHSENSTQFQMVTTDWTTGSTTLAECKLQQCLELNINLFPDKVQNLKNRSKFNTR